MSNILLGFPNRADIGTYSGGSWSGALPASNLGTREQWQVGRSTNALTTSTKFSVDFGRMVNFRSFALANHNLSQSASWRVKLGTTAGADDLYDSAFQAVWHLPFDSDMLEWESSSYWEGALDDPSEYLGHPYLASHTLPTWINARYLTIEIDDTTNAAGYVQIGRLFAGGGLQPEYNAAYGLKDSWIDNSELIETDSGYTLAYLKRRRRAVSFALPWISHDEAALVHEIQRRQGLWGEVLYLPDPSNQTKNQRYGFIGRLAELSAIDYPYYNRRTVGFSLKEL